MLSRDILEITASLHTGSIEKWTSGLKWLKSNYFPPPPSLKRVACCWQWLCNFMFNTLQVCASVSPSPSEITLLCLLYWCSACLILFACTESHFLFYCALPQFRVISGAFYSDFYLYHKAIWQLHCSFVTQIMSQWKKYNSNIDCRRITVCISLLWK